MPDAISSTSTDRDSLRIYMADTSNIISCVESSDVATTSRLLQDSAFSIPSQTVLRVEIPPQRPTGANGERTTLLKYEDADSATDILFLGIGMSSLLSMPSQVLYDGIIAVQIISHIPLNNINLP